LPWGQTHLEVRQGTAECHHQIADAVLPQPHPVFDDPTALDAAVEILDAPPPLGERLVRPLLLPRELLPQIDITPSEDSPCRVDKVTTSD
jgi:hypothetical protein